MKKVLLIILALIGMIAMSANAQTTVVVSFDSVGSWVPSGSGQNINVATGNAIAVETALHVTEGTGCAKLTLNWSKPAVVTTESLDWPGTAPEWGCRVYFSGTITSTAALADTLSIDIYNDTGEALQFALCVKDGGGTGKLFRGPWRTLVAGANTYTFVPQTDAVNWNSSGAISGNVGLNSLLFTSDDEPVNGQNIFYVDNFTRTGVQTDVTAPAVPKLNAVVPISQNQVRVTWTGVSDSDLAGYRLYKATSFSLTNLLSPIAWDATPVQNETILTASTTQATVTIDGLSSVTLFKITSVDTATPAKNESGSGTPLAVYMTGTTAMPKVLCAVDIKRFVPGELNFAGSGFKYDRYIIYLANALKSLNKPFYSTTEKGIEAGNVTLSAANFDLVAYSTAADGNVDTQPAVSATSITPLKNYLDNGGTLFLSGSNIVKSLNDTPEGQSLLGYCGVSYATDDGEVLQTVVPGSAFGGLTVALKTDSQYDYAAYATTTSASASGIKNDVMSLAGAFSGVTYEIPAGGVAVAYKKGSYTTVISGMAFETIRQDTTTSKNARNLFLQAIFDLNGAAPTLDAKQSWNLYE